MPFQSITHDVRDFSNAVQAQRRSPSWWAIAPKIRVRFVPGRADERYADVAAESELELTADILEDGLFLCRAATALSFLNAHTTQARVVLSAALVSRVMVVAKVMAVNSACRKRSEEAHRSHSNRTDS
jgi:hypothetical protein